MKTSKIAILVFTVGLLPAAEVFAGDPHRGETQYVVCAACHGEDGAGNATLRVPRIAGLDSDYVAQQLQLFRDGIRGHPDSAFANQMRIIALTLQDEQAVADVAAYVETLPAPPAPPPITGDLVHGEQIYGMCAPCHGQNAEGREIMAAPGLAGQSDFYLADQLRAFIDGLRGYPEDIRGTQMRYMAKLLKDDRMVSDVVAYIGTLEAPAPSPTIDGDAERGAASYQRLCVACHGETGAGSAELKAPRLAGQQDWYMMKQMESFRSGLRGVHPRDIYGAQMRQIAILLEEDEIRDVISYINSFASPEQ